MKTIRNKRTGEVKVINENELSQYGLAPSVSKLQPLETQPQEETPFLRKASNLLSGLGLSAIPTIAGAGYELYRAGKKGLTGDESVYLKENPFLSEEELERIQQRPLEAIGRQTAGLAAWGLPGAKAGTTLTQTLGRNLLRGAVRGGAFTAAQPETGLGQIASGAAGGAVLEPLFRVRKALRHPIEATGKALEATQKARGVVPQEKIVEKFGTMRAPKEELLWGTAPAGKLSGAREVLEKELGQLATGAELKGLKPPLSYHDILGYRTGAGKAAYEAGAPAWQKPLYKNIQRAYSELLKAGSPDTRILDKLYSSLKIAEKGKKAAFKLAPFAVGYYLLRGLIQKALSPFSP